MQKPWNRANYTVYSLATINAVGQGNMNICTYAIPITLSPKKYVIGLYNNTQTLINVQQTKTAVLQLLGVHHKDVVRRFGYSSGKDKDKLKNLKHQLFPLNNIPVLADCLAYLQLEFEEFIDIKGDHVLGIAKVVSAKNLYEGECMTVQHLKEWKIMR